MQNETTVFVSTTNKPTITTGINNSGVHVPLNKNILTFFQPVVTIFNYFFLATQANDYIVTEDGLKILVQSNSPAVNNTQINNVQI